MKRKHAESDDVRKFDPDVLRSELSQILRRREAHGLEDCAAAKIAELEKHDKVLPKAREQRLVGLALSGGGIRSATFNLGLLQGLAKLKLLALVDCLSTVSGGGYIGSWLAAWIQRDGSFERVEKTLAAASSATDLADNPLADGGCAISDVATPPVSLLDGAASDSVKRDPIGHLRRHSNYLAPRQGFLSADMWVLWASYLRNFLLNQMALFPALLVVLLVVRFGMWLYFPWKDDFASVKEFSWVMVFFAVIMAFCLIASLAGLLRGAKDVVPKARDLTQGDGHAWAAVRLLLPVLGLTVFAFLFCAYVPYRPLLMHVRPFGLPLWTCFAIPATVLAGSCYFFAVLIPLGQSDIKDFVKLFACALAGLIGGVLLYGVFQLLSNLYVTDGMWPGQYIRVTATAWVITVGPPLVLFAMVVTMAIGVGILKGSLRDDLREWWSAVCARLLMAAVLWLGVSLVALHGTAFVLWAGPSIWPVLGSSWVVTVLAGVVAGGGPQTGLKRSGTRLLDWLARLAPPVFLVGLVIGASVLLHFVIDNVPQWRSAQDDVWIRHHDSEFPARQVSVVKTSKLPGAPTQERREATEVKEVVYPEDIVRQMFWVGILNTQPNFVPRVSGYFLKPFDDACTADGKLNEYFKSMQLPLSFSTGWNALATKMEARKKQYVDDIEEKPWFAPAVVAKAVGLAAAPWGAGPSLAAEELRAEEGPFRRKFFDHNEFEKGLGTILKDVPGDARDAVSARTWQGARQVQLMAFDPLKLFAKIGGWIGACLLLMLVAMWRVDVNLFSLQSVYGNRLIRCYLGASRPLDGPRASWPRRPDPVTGMDPNDDLALADLQDDKKQDDKKYDGPYLIVNTALNLVRSERLDWQERKAESFVLTARYCGSEGTGYRRTDPDPQTKKAYADNVTVGNAVALSGAAASPNMGYHSSPAVTALLTVFNARLGAWLGNPASPTRWNRSGPSLGFLHLVRELFGFTREDGGYVFLSDGGHFENLGAYELIRRRCQFIIVSDAGNDPDHTFEDLSNLIHKCRVDFGVEIDIKLDSLRRSELGRTTWHCAVGHIHYEQADEDAGPGILVYLKPSLNGDEPTDVLQYRDRNPDFPHDPTSNQFFTESRFEAYRALGEHVALTTFGPSESDMRAERARHGAESAGAYHQRRCLALFSSMVRRWFAMPPEYEASFLDCTRRFIEIQEALRKDARLWRLSMDLYPELDPGREVPRDPPKESGNEAAQRRATELHLIVQMLQVMETAWLSLNLDVHYAHPLNRGWLDVFHRWTDAAAVRELWPVVRSEFARGFVSFCEKQMRMGEVKALIRPLKRKHLETPALRRLLLELADQWPQLWPGKLEPWLEKSENGKSHKTVPRGWLVEPESAFPGGMTPPMPCGIILLNPTEEDGANELFVWMRGAYRNSGLGRSAVEHVLDELSKRSPPRRLRVRLLVGDLEGAGGEVQKNMWLTFFYHHMFLRAHSKNRGPDSAKEIILERDNVVPVGMPS